MTTQMTRFRENPLLLPPKRDSLDWAVLRDEDVKPIMQYFEEKRFHRQGDFMLEAYYMMKTIGIKVELTEQDKELISATLDEDRQRQPGHFGMMKIHYCRKKLGMPTDVTDEDKAIMRNELQIGIDMRIGSNISIVLSTMKCLEIPHTMSDSNIRTMHDYLNAERSGQTGHSLTSHHLHLKELGCPAQFTDEDISITRKHIESLRNSDRKENIAWVILQILYNMHELGLKPEPNTQPLPPLKKM